MLAFRALARSDLSRLLGWLNTPHVYEWWGRRMGPGALGGAGGDAATEAEVEEKYGPEIDLAGSTHRFIIELDGAPIGLVQWYRLSDFLDYARAIGEDSPGGAGIDLLIGESDAVGRGIGPRVLDAFVRQFIFAESDLTRAVSGPAAGNVRSIRAFEKAGFVRIRDATIPGEPDPEAIMVRIKAAIQPA